MNAYSTEFGVVLAVQLLWALWNEMGRNVEVLGDG